jgi:hypothetical protein
VVPASLALIEIPDGRLDQPEVPPDLEIDREDDENAAG